MATTRKLVTCVSKKDFSYQPHERIESIGGFCDGIPWNLTTEEAIRNIKKGAEQYFMLSAGKTELKIVIATCQNKEFLKTETDLDTPDNLLGLPQFFEIEAINYFANN